MGLEDKSGGWLMAEDGVEVFNNGRGWRIAINLRNGRTTMDRQQAENLSKKLITALSRLEDRERES
jgi:hypothetical protein